MRKVLLIIGLLSCFMYTTSQEKRLALVIGNGNYGNSILRNPENDARDMEQVLKAIGFKVIKYENITRIEMAKAIDDFGIKLKDYDLGLFFYAGHGVQANGLNYMLPVDAVIKTESDIEFNGVRADRVLARMDEANNKLNIMIMDACRDNPYERSWTRSALGKGLATMTAPVGSLIGFATSPGKTASDGYMSNGLYTSGILKYIGEPGITAIQMFQKVTAYVQEESNGVQLPWLSSSLTGDIYFVKDSASMPILPEIDKNSLYVNSISKLPEPTEDDVALAILPFNNLTGDESNSWLVTGQYETLLNELSKLSVDVPLRVVSTGTVRRLKYYEMSTQEIARQIGVDYLVEGSLLSFKDSIILQLRLVQVIPNEKVIWANSFTSDVSNILRLHSSIAAEIAEKLDWGDQSIELLANRTASQEPRQVKPEAYKTYLRGMHNIRQPEKEKKLMGLKMLREAVNLDPADPFAYAALALGYLEIEHTGLDPEGDALIKAEAAAKQAFRLDSTMVDVIAAMSEVYMYQTFEYDKALKYFKKALALNPNRAATHYHYSWALYILGDKEGAIREHELAVKFDPLNPYYVAWLGGLYAFYGEYEKAFQELTNASLIFEDYYLCYSLGGYIYRKQGRYDEAIRIHKLLVKDIPWMMGALGATYAAAGDTINAEKIMAQLEADINPTYAFQLAGINAILGRVDEAFKWLDYKPKSGLLPWIAVNPDFNSLHSDPRFDQLVKSFNLPKLE